MRHLSVFANCFFIVLAACSSEVPVQKMDWRPIENCKNHGNSALCLTALSTANEIDALAGERISVTETIRSAETNGQTVVVALDLRFKPGKRTVGLLKLQKEQLRTKACNSELSHQFIKQGGKYQFRMYQPDGELFSEFVISNCYKNTERVSDLSETRT